LAEIFARSLDRRLDPRVVNGFLSDTKPATGCVAAFGGKILGTSSATPTPANRRQGESQPKRGKSVLHGQAGPTDGIATPSR
jgi:hypothetical protein